MITLFVLFIALFVIIVELMLNYDCKQELERTQRTMRIYADHIDKHIENQRNLLNRVRALEKGAQK